MAASSVTPIAGLLSTVTVGGTAVKAANGTINGGLISNPATATEQGVSTAEYLFFDIVGGCATPAAGGTIIGIPPGGSCPLVPGQTTATYVNAATSGHKFTIITW